jgi:hypothetical protein
MKSEKFDWRKHWGGMPEFVAEDKRPEHTVRVWLPDQTAPPGKKTAFVTVHFRKRDLKENLAKFSEILFKAFGRTVLAGFSYETPELTIPKIGEQALTDVVFGPEKRKIGHHSFWFPWRENDPHSKFAYVQEGGKIMNPRYPVYVISKGRWGLPLTARALERMGVPYFLVVEPKEHKNYEESLSLGYDGGKSYSLVSLLVAPENFSERGQGSIPVRNFVWRHAVKCHGKEARHWLMDDNIPTFNRTHNNLGIRVLTGAIFRVVEDFADRYENVAITGLQNSQFVISKWEWPAFFLNTRVYSCTLIKNDLDLRTKEYTTDSGITVPRCDEPHWRGRYNEDTDLCIRALKKGWCTVLFVTFNADKVGTMVMKGGNTDVLYSGDGRTKMAESLVKQHPDVARVGDRWNRKQHIVNYPASVEVGRRAAENGGGVLKLRKDAPVFNKANEYGMIKKRIK